jgi:hypothetical protein
VTVSVSVLVLLARSRAVTVTTLVPRLTLADQLVVPLAVPEPPRSLLHVTCARVPLSLAVPPIASVGTLAAYVVADVGVVIATTGGMVSVFGTVKASESLHYSVHSSSTSAT